jgi:hypothetical protein
VHRRRGHTRLVGDDLLLLLDLMLWLLLLLVLLLGDVRLVSDFARLAELVGREATEADFGAGWWHWLGL